MNSDEIARIAMACFVEGLDPATLALAPHHLAQAESRLAEIRGDSDTDTYCRCLDLLSIEAEGAK